MCISSGRGVRLRRAQVHQEERAEERLGARAMLAVASSNHDTEG